MDSATGRRAEIMVEYLGYLNQLKEGEAGVLTVSGTDESPTALRRRIGKAAQAAGKEVVIRRKGDAIMPLRAASAWMYALGGAVSSMTGGA